MTGWTDKAFSPPLPQLAWPHGIISQNKSEISQPCQPHYHQAFASVFITHLSCSGFGTLTSQLYTRRRILKHSSTNIDHHHIDHFMSCHVMSFLCQIMTMSCIVVMIQNMTDSEYSVYERLCFYQCVRLNIQQIFLYLNLHCICIDVNSLGNLVKFLHKMKFD